MFIDIYKDLMKYVNRPEAPSGEIDVVNVTPVSATSFHIDDTLAACYMANGTLINDIWELKTGNRQKIKIDYVHSSLSYLSFALLYQNDHPVIFPDRHRVWPNYPIMSTYKTRDNRHIFIDGVYPPLRDGLLDLFNCPNNERALSTAIIQWEAEDLEYQINKRNLCGTIVRTSEEWKNHPQGKVLSKIPPILIEKKENTAPVPFLKEGRPLTGIKVIDFTHLLAAPVSTRSLAEQGAEVLHISGPRVYEFLPFVIDTSFGKTNTFLDLAKEVDRNTLIDLIKDADVFVQGYTPGKFKELGFGPEDIHRINPKAIYVTVSCFGTEGPWATYKGFEQIGQAVSGLMAGHSSLENPQLLPAAVCDYLTGYLCSLGILTALYRRATEGGSYTVEVSLVRSGMLVESYGHREGKEASGKIPDDLEPFFTVSKTAYGDIKHFKPVIQMSETKGDWEIPLTPLGSSLPMWRSDKG